MFSFRSRTPVAGLFPPSFFLESLLPDLGGSGLDQSTFRFGDDRHPQAIGFVLARQKLAAARPARNSARAGLLPLP